MSECILVRHAQTDWNKKEIFRGRAEVELNRTGIRHAEKTSTLLADLPIDGICTSPLKRSIVTAQILARPHSVKPREYPGLIDIDYGEWQGLMREEVERKFTGLYTQWINQPHLVKFPEGESLSDVEKRAVACFKEIVESHNFSIIVSHRVVIKVILLHILGLPLSAFWKVKQDPCAITRIDYNGGRYTILSLNESYHLYKPLKDRKGDF
jgi:broad specificity phosphatase PhoE